MQQVTAGRLYSSNQAAADSHSSFRHSCTLLCMHSCPCLFVADDELVQKASKALDEIKAAGTLKVERQITTPQSATVGEHGFYSSWHTEVAAEGWHSLRQGTGSRHGGWVAYVHSDSQVLVSAALLNAWMFSPPGVCMPSGHFA